MSAGPSAKAAPAQSSAMDEDSDEDETVTIAATAVAMESAKSTPQVTCSPPRHCSEHCYRVQAADKKIPGEKTPKSKKRKKKR